MQDSKYEQGYCFITWTKGDEMDLNISIENSVQILEIYYHQLLDKFRDTYRLEESTVYALMGIHTRGVRTGRNNHQVS